MHKSDTFFDHSYSVSKTEICLFGNIASPLNMCNFCKGCTGYPDGLLSGLFITGIRPNIHFVCRISGHITGYQAGRTKK